MNWDVEVSGVVMLSSGLCMSSCALSRTRMMKSSVWTLVAAVRASDPEAHLSHVDHIMAPYSVGRSGSSCRLSLHHIHRTRTRCSHLFARVSSKDRSSISAHRLTLHAPLDYLALVPSYMENALKQIDAIGAARTLLSKVEELPCAGVQEGKVL